jgi:hypothetical protein
VAITMSVLSTEYILQPVYVTTLGQAYNPTSDEVQFAFKPPGADPGGSDWIAGSWWTAQQPDGAWMAQVLVGPASSGDALTPGIYVIWLRVTDNPEVPVRTPGLLEITP